MAQTVQLKMHIINYSKTKDVYAAYKKSGKKEAYEEFKQARKTMVEYQTAKDNVDRILGTVLLEKELEKKKESPR